MNLSAERQKSSLVVTTVHLKSSHNDETKFLRFLNPIKRQNFALRPLTALELTDTIMDMYLNDPVATWGDRLYALDFPKIRIGMCSFFATALQLTFEEEIMDQIVEVLVNSFSGYVILFLRIKRSECCMLEHYGDGCT